MNLKKIRIEGLFHSFTHEVLFRHKENIAIIIGENGIGKTTILKIIDSIFSKNFEFLFSIDFVSIEIEFTKDKWKISKLDNNSLLLTSSSFKLEHKIKSSKDETNTFLRRFLIRVDDNEWYDRRRGISFTREEIIQKYEYDPIEPTEMLPDWINEILTSNNVLFIQTQRIYKLDYSREREGKYLEYMIQTYSKELVKLLQQNNSQFTSQSIQLDSSFPIRLLQEIKKSKKNNYINNIDEIISEINNLIKYRTLLSTVGIIEKQSDEVILKSLDALNDNNTLPILNLYISDNKKKLDIFQDTARKLEILLNIINKRFKHKKLFIDKSEGFVIESDIDHKKIDLVNLSSGEQNELIIFYTLLFRTKKNDLVLIDEPEISLHIAWQQKLIEDLKDIVKETGISIVISTHSPDIIGDNWSLVQTLSGDK